MNNVLIIIYVKFCKYGYLIYKLLQVLVYVKYYLKFEIKTQI